MEKPVFLSQEIYDLILKNLHENETFEGILDNLSSFLKNRIKVFEYPKLMLNCVFDVDEVEYKFTEQSIVDLINAKELINVKRLIDRSTKILHVDIIKESFENGCVIDYLV